MSDPPLVHYLTRHLRIPCRPDLRTLEGAPLNSTITEMVTCPECRDAISERDTTLTAKPIPVVVTTQHRGVFFGNTTSPRDARTVELTDAQMCVYWSADVKGVMGLAATGPSRSCRVGPPVPRITLQDVTAVIDATDEAVKLWQDRPWS